MSMKVQYVPNPQHPGQMVVQMQMPLNVAQVVGEMCKKTFDPDDVVFDIWDSMQLLGFIIGEKLGESGYSINGEIILGE